MSGSALSLHRPFKDRSFGLVRKFLRMNWLFVICVCALAGVGYVALYSAAGGATTPYANSQLIRFCTGLLMMFAIAMVDIRLIAKTSWFAYAVGIVLLVVVMKFGHTGLGAKRWISLGGVEIQPSELMKLFLVLALAAYFHKASYERIGNVFFLIPAIVAIMIPVGLILKEPNLGTAVITAAIGCTVMLGAGVRWWKFAIVIVMIAIAAPVLYHHLHDYQRARIITFMNPGSDPLGAGYNIIQSKIALGSGGWNGQGFLHGTQNQLNFLPEKQTDFVFTIIAEEFGFVGSAATLVLLFSIVAIALYTALRSEHQYGRLVALGIATNFFLYCFVNLSMVMGLIPVGGVPLPLISYGGSALTAVMLGFGVLMSVHVHRDAEFAVDEF
ncbi:MAG: rod shape-determining protein RodA [Acidocella sp. 20-57-95]|nr:MAG: rod shape-determining protein RodA [Acidocella sp. 20-57-95]OYV58134.1 MAG: rod shape-determining protein RodA [Acidocella sp. 21-58-7]HQT64253.1 rod shape-determining protein RodA [Acidocella sp.]HQU05363.1 rod shape-determining protein RodA [Acidocella sp.]